MRAGWANQPERGALAAVRLIRWITLHLGRWVARPLLCPITAYFVLTAAAQRRASREYLARVLGREPGIADVFRHFHCFAATILDRVFLIRGEAGRFDLHVHGAAESFAEGRPRGGCILLGSHMGSFEVMRMLAQAHGHMPLKVLMYEDHNAGVTGALHELNPDFARMVIPLGAVDALLRARESVEQGEMLGILGDRVAESDKTMRCRFLGGEAVFPCGPMLLASMLGVPVVLFFGLYRGGNRYDLHFELFAERIDIGRASREGDLRRWIVRYVERLEHYAREAPYNWFNFYDFWEETKHAG